MAAESARHVALVGLEITDAAAYARYRAGMAPILARHGGDFGVDLEIAAVLKGPHPRLNRVFTIRFPDRARRQAFFADPAYLAVRAAHFEPAVAATVILAEFDEP